MVFQCPLDLFDDCLFLASFLNCFPDRLDFDADLLGDFLVVFASFEGYCCLESAFLVELGNLECSLALGVCCGFIGFAVDFKGKLGIPDSLAVLVLQGYCVFLGFCIIS